MQLRFLLCFYASHIIATTQHSTCTPAWTWVLALSLTALGCWQRPQAGHVEYSEYRSQPRGRGVGAQLARGRGQMVRRVMFLLHSLITRPHWTHWIQCHRGLFSALTVCILANFMVDQMGTYGVMHRYYDEILPKLTKYCLNLTDVTISSWEIRYSNMWDPHCRYCGCVYSAGELK